MQICRNLCIAYHSESERSLVPRRFWKGDAITEMNRCKTNSNILVAKKRCRGKVLGAVLCLLLAMALAALYLLCRISWYQGRETTLSGGQADREIPSTENQPSQLPAAWEGADAQSGDTDREMADILLELWERGETDERFAAIAEEAESYPRNLLLLALKNEEAVDFVAGYLVHEADVPDSEVIDLSGDYIPGEVPLLLQWDARWGYASYGTNLMGVAGCGPTCLSMVIVGLTGNLAANPLAVAEYSEAQGWYVDGQGTSWELMRTGAENFGLGWRELPLAADTIYQALDFGECIIASMLPGDFTDSGHFIVICGYDETGFRILDPNSRVRSEQNWSYEALAPQIGNLWAYTAL